MIKALLLLAPLASAYELSARAGVTPIEKVITLLEDMHAKGVKELKDEQVSFSSFKQWCTDTSANKEKSIKEATEEIENLNSAIAKAEADADQLGEEIMALDSDISGFQSEMQAATEIRDKEKEDYKAEHTDLSESVDAVGRAVNVVKSKAASKAQAMVQLKVVSNLSKTPKQAQRALQAFLQMGEDPEGLSVTAPEAAGYEFQSDGIVDMLEKLKDKFSDELSACEKEEMEKKHAYQMMMQDLQDEIERATAEKGRKVKSKATRQEDAAGFKGDLADTTASKDADEKYLSDMVAGCSQKSDDFESRQKLRSDELVALEKATEILKSGDVSGSGEAHLPSFAMLRSSYGGTELLQARIVLRRLVQHHLSV